MPFLPSMLPNKLNASGGVACDVRGALPTASDLHSVEPSRKDFSRQGGAQAFPRVSAPTRYFRSSSNHSATGCGFCNAECHFCKRRGHIVYACRQKEATSTRTRTKCSSRQGKLSDKNTGRVGAYGLYQAHLFSYARVGVRSEDPLIPGALKLPPSLARGFTSIPFVGGWVMWAGEHFCLFYDTSSF